MCWQAIILASGKPHILLLPPTGIIDLIHEHSYKILCRPEVKSAYQKIAFLISHHVVGTQKNRLNEMVLLSTQNIC